MKAYQIKTQKKFRNMRKVSDNKEKEGGNTLKKATTFQKNKKKVTKGGSEQSQGNTKKKISSGVNSTPSSTALPTNYTDNDSKKNDMPLPLHHLGKLLQVSNFKKTIIIDDQGNNNLNLVVNNKLSNEKENIIKEKEETDSVNRLKEYKMIFNLLNSNIEQMKDMFNSNNQNPEPVKPDNKILTDEVIANINNVTQEKPNSFLESCIHDDFFLALKDTTGGGGTNNSFEFSSIINLDDTHNLDQTEMETDEKMTNFNIMQRNKLNPHFLLKIKGKSRSGNSRSKNTLKEQPQETPKTTDNVNKCIVF